MITYAQFIADYPAFGNATTFPESAFSYWANMAGIMLTCRWGEPAPAGQPLTLYDIGCELFIAHNLVLEAMSQQAVNAGGLPGINRGVVSAESAGAVSVSYDTNAGIEPGAGHWNLTVYGTRFIQNALMVGAGPSVASPCAPLVPNNGQAWSGPSMWPGSFSS